MKEHLEVSLLKLEKFNTLKKQKHSEKKNHPKKGKFVLNFAIIISLITTTVAATWAVANKIFEIKEDRKSVV